MQLVLTGHSLGAGTAVLAGLLLAAPTEMPVDGTAAAGWAARLLADPMVYAFAPPQVVSAELARGPTAVERIVSVINGDDGEPFF